MGTTVRKNPRSAISSFQSAETERKEKKACREIITSMEARFLRDLFSHAHARESLILLILVRVSRLSSDAQTKILIFFRRLPLTFHLAGNEFQLEDLIKFELNNSQIIRDFKRSR